jgi:hypothetical protein
MLVVSLISFVLAIYGHATLVASFRFIGIASAGVSLLAFVVLAGEFHAVHGGRYALGEYWPTWVLTMVLAASAGHMGPSHRRLRPLYPVLDEGEHVRTRRRAGHLRGLLAG